MLLDELYFLDEASFTKKLGTSAALAAGLAYGGGALYNFANPPSPNISFQQSNYNPADDANSININNIPKPAASKPAAPQDNTAVKKTFIQKIKPLIDNQNNQIISDRKFLISVSKNQNLSNEQQEKFTEISKKYGTSNIKELLLRVDIIPDDLALAQSALESGWGTSSFAVKDKSLFGQKASRDSNDFASYDSFQQSINSYMHNLNTNPAYDKFRNARYYMRKHGDELNATLLARTLVAYDSTGNKYTKKIQTMINKVIPGAEKLAMNEARKPKEEIPSNIVATGTAAPNHTPLYKGVNKNGKTFDIYWGRISDWIATDGTITIRAKTLKEISERIDDIK